MDRERHFDRRYLEDSPTDDDERVKRNSYAMTEGQGRLRAGVKNQMGDRNGETQDSARLSRRRPSSAGARRSPKEACPGQRQPWVMEQGSPPARSTRSAGWHERAPSPRRTSGDARPCQQGRPRARPLRIATAAGAEEHRSRITHGAHHEPSLQRSQTQVKKRQAARSAGRNGPTRRLARNELGRAHTASARPHSALARKTLMQPRVTGLSGSKLLPRSQHEPGPRA